MRHRLLMVCAQRPRQPVFPGDFGPVEIESRRPVRLSGSLPKSDRVWCGPDALTRRSADALGVTAEVKTELAEVDFGSWRGRSIEDVAKSDPDGFRAWLSDPSVATHGGESTKALIDRVEGWLADCGRLSGRTVAIAPASVVKACLLLALKAPSTSFSLIDLEPLSRVTLVSDGRRWVFRTPSEVNMPESSSDTFS
ncbi:histidine phosphatase family protein [Methylopila sp. 73B]|uniref:histidine phosphatase family protein n=1 Tax=Methylopila sp. 73B TaxID=1120792 RepID=UPI0009DF1D3E|nr:histidine phosphatase family protein [Methylopila sp. 73B]